ncbi:hypothetical protein Q9966_003994 [Columba livia]|nr:hypothetical protein Q9966_003994 [Columba livia]
MDTLGVTVSAYISTEFHPGHVWSEKHPLSIFLMVWIHSAYFQRDLPTNSGVLEEARRSSLSAVTRLEVDGTVIKILEVYQPSYEHTSSACEAEQILWKCQYNMINNEMIVCEQVPCTPMAKKTLNRCFL